MTSESTLSADVDQEWSRLQAGIANYDDLAEEMQQKMIATHDAIQLYLTVKRAKGSAAEINFFCAAKLFNAMEELFRTL